MSDNPKPILNLYLIERTCRTGYDEYDSAVVVAETSFHARMIHPSGHYNGKDNKWGGTVDEFDSWVNADTVNVTHLGKADNVFKANEVICASFNAG